VEESKLYDLRSFIKELEDRGELHRVKKPVSIKYQISALMKEYDGKDAVLFENVEGYLNRVVCGVCGTKERLCLALGISRENLYDLLLNSIKNPITPRMEREAPVKEVEEKPRITRIPILYHYEGDAGRYITSGIVAAKSPDGKIENVSIHRLLVLDDTHLAIRIVPRHLYRLCQMARENKDKTLDVGIAIGLHPAVSLAASSPAPFGVSEYAVANAMMRNNLTVTNCEAVNANVPADAELVLEGRILLEEEVDEGPFTDITGTYDIARKQPVVEVVKVFHREDYIYQGLLPAGMEHKLLMGLPFEARIMEAVKAVVPNVKAVNLTPGGCCWLHAAISIEKQAEGDGKNAILAAFSAHPSLKHVIVVDSDIDVNNLNEIEWAVATRFQGDRGLVTLSNVRGSTVDPSADQVLALTTKVGLDATMTMLKPKERFIKARIPV
jgi:UbiD family decarboxylase